VDEIDNMKVVQIKKLGSTTVLFESKNIVEMYIYIYIG